MRAICLLLLLISISSLHASYLHTEIFGGDEVKGSEFSSTVLLVTKINGEKKPFCSGVLIQQDMILTAAHCIANNRLRPLTEKVTVFVGNSYNQKSSYIHTIKEATYHPDFFTSVNEINDIAYIILNKPVDISTAQLPLLPASREEIDSLFVKDTPAILVGFGNNEEGVIGIKHKAYTHFVEPLPSNEFIVGGEGKDSCDGDSGGPVYMNLNSNLVVVGISSRGVDSSADGCGKGGIYTNIHHHLEWISSASNRVLARTDISK